jgi:hypothetical protein
LYFADEQSGSPAACPRCGAALTVPRMGVLVWAGDKQPPAALKKHTAVEKPPSVPDAPVPAAAPPRRLRPWLAAAVLLVVAGPPALLLLPKDRPHPPPTEEPASPDEPAPGPIAQADPDPAPRPPERVESVSPIVMPRRPAEQPTPAAELGPDPRQLQRLRAEKEAAGDLARDVRRELRLLRAEQAERQAEAEEVRRQLQLLRVELWPDSVRSVKEAVAPGEEPFDRLASGGRAALADRDYETAVRDLTRAAVLDPTDRDVRDLLAAAREALERLNKEVPEALAKAKLALLDGDVEAARNIYAVLLVVAPRDRRVRDAVGQFQSRIAKKEIPDGESRWLTAEEIEALTGPRPRRSYDWSLGGVNPEVTARAVAHGHAYRLSLEEQTARSRSVGAERDVALQNETDRAGRAGREHDAGADEEAGRMRSAWNAGLESLTASTGRSARAGREAHALWEAQDARVAQIGRELEGVWRQQDQRAHDAAAGQMLGLLQQHGRIVQAARDHDALAREQGERMAAGGGGGGAAWAEQGERVMRAGRDNDAGLRLLIGRAEEAGRRWEAGARAQDDRGNIARREGGPGGEVGDRFRAGVRAGRENVIGKGRIDGGGHNAEADERSRAAVGRLTARELEDRITGGARGQRLALDVWHTGAVKPSREVEAPPPPPRVESPAEKQKERDEAERALAERNRKAREAEEQKRLLAEREQRQRDLEELKKLVREKEAMEREAAELKLLQAEKERLQRLRDFKGVTEDQKK